MYIELYKNIFQRHNLYQSTSRGKYWEIPGNMNCVGITAIYNTPISFHHTFYTHRLDTQ